MKKRLVTPYFPPELKYGSLLVVCGGVYLAATNHIGWGVLLIALGAVFFSTEYVTEFDVQARTINDYISFLWIPLNRETIYYGSIDRIVIRKERFAQTVNTRAQSRQVDWAEFTATLIFHDTDAFEILTRNRKKELLLAIRDVAFFIGADVEDQTTHQPYLIDLSKVE